MISKEMYDFISSINKKLIRWDDIPEDKRVSREYYKEFEDILCWNDISKWAYLTEGTFFLK